MASAACTLNKRETAYMLGVDVRSISAWQGLKTNPLPIAKVGGRGKPNAYDAAEVLQWYVARKIDALTVSADGDYIDFDRERARLTKEQADQTALKNAQLRGELAPIEMLEWVLGQVGAQIAAILETIPMKVKRKVPKLGSSEVELIRREIVKAQNLAARVEIDMNEYRDDEDTQSVASGGSR